MSKNTDAIKSFAKDYSMNAYGSSHGRCFVNSGCAVLPDTSAFINVFKSSQYQNEG